MLDFFADNAVIVVTGIFVCCVALGMLAQALAQEKGHGKQWFWAGCLLPLVGIIWAAGLPDVRLRDELRQLRQPPAEKAEGTAVAQRDQDQDRDTEIAAAIAASFAVLQGSTGRRFLLRSFRRAPGPTVWARSGSSRGA
jgi:hypothetical protein